MTRKWFELQLSSHFWSELFSFNLHLSTFHFISIIFNRVDEMKKVLPTFTSGRTTASMVFVTKDNYIFVNYGDSRSVLYDEKGMRFETKDNNASDEIEKKRIIAAGYRVIFDGGLSRVSTDGVSGLNMARALGSHHYKTLETGELFFLCSILLEIHLIF